MKNLYRSRTTFVVGAGASLELGFPTGSQLKEEISKGLDIRFDRGSRPTRGDFAVAEALRQYADHHKGEAEQYNTYLEAGWHISRAMPQAISIDNFIENQEDKKVTAIAKLGIASCLIDAEKNCRLRFQRELNNVSTINWEEIQKTWIHPLMQTLTAGTKRSSADEIFNKIDFIVFNYDRSLEFYLTHSIANYYNMPIGEAHGIVAKANFMHPYGQIGKLRWQTEQLPIMDFGTEDKSSLYEISRSILTFSEQIEDATYLDRIRSSIDHADQIVFLGFAFHDSNMALLKPQLRTRDTMRVIATAFGISSPDCDVIMDEIRDLCIREGEFRLKYGKYILDNSATSSSLFQKYTKSLLS